MASGSALRALPMEQRVPMRSRIDLASSPHVWLRECPRRLPDRLLARAPWPGPRGNLVGSHAPAVHPGRGRSATESDEALALTDYLLCCIRVAALAGCPGAQGVAGIRRCPSRERNRGCKVAARWLQGIRI